MAHRILLATSSTRLRDTLDEQLAADDYSTTHPGTPQHAATLLASRPFDLLLLADFEQPASALDLLRDLRAGRLTGHARADLPVVTLGGGGELDALRAYRAGSDHHLTADTGYLLIHAAITAVLRRVEAPSVRRQIGPIEIDPHAREVRVHGELVELTNTEYRLRGSSSNGATIDS